jgi:hypothetical protein
MQAAVVVPLVCAIGFAVSSVQQGDSAASLPLRVVFAAMAFAVLGWPLALALGAIPAIACGKALQRRNRAAINGTIAYSTIVGGAGVPFVWAQFGEGGVATMAIAGAIAGFLAGSYFCLLVSSRASRRQ